jgi:carboxymethylenebutenolidase
MGKMIAFTRPDGKTASGYLAEPSDPQCTRGIVMFEEWWGLNEQMKETADRLARDGFRAIVPDLYGGRVADTREEAGHLMEGLDFADAATQDAVGAARYLKAHGARKVAVGGFCMGGALALLAAMNGRDFDAVVTWYGFPPPEAGDPARISVPIQGHWAEHDEFFKADHLNELERRLAAAGAAYEFHRYDAKHAFFNPGGLGNYHREHAETAWRRMVEFLNRTLQ